MVEAVVRASAAAIVASGSVTVPAPVSCPAGSTITAPSGTAYWAEPTAPAPGVPRIPSGSGSPPVLGGVVEGAVGVDGAGSGAATSSCHAARES